MANKYMKKSFLMSHLPLGKIQIKTTIRYHFTAMGITKMKTSDNIKCWREFRETGSLFHGCSECKILQLSSVKSLEFSLKN